MNINKKLGQMMMFGFPGTELDAASLSLINDYKVSNIILFLHNYKTSGQLTKLCNKIHALVQKSTGHPALIFIDQEGGVVSRMPSDLVSFPSAMGIGATNDVNNAYTAAYCSAKELAAMGVNCNLAPVMDINTNSQNPVIGVRSYGKDANLVTEYSMAAVKGQEDAGVLSVVKHFPGHGDTEVDSHLGLPCVRKNFSQLSQCELIPFKKAIADKVPCIMAAHIIYPDLDGGDFPASMSCHIITGVLRNMLKYDGLVVTDCLEMGAIKDNFGTENGFVKALCAGVDIACISHTPKVAIKAMNAAIAAVEKGELTLERLDNANRHITEVRQKYVKATAEIPTVTRHEYKAKALDMMLSAVTREDHLDELPAINANTFFTGCPAYRATFASSEPAKDDSFAQIIASKFGAKFCVTPVNPSKIDIENVIANTKKGQTVVVNTYNGHLNSGQILLVNTLCRQERIVVALALRNPYDLALIDNRAYKLAFYEYTPLSIAAAKIVLKTKLSPGKIVY